MSRVRMTMHAAGSLHAHSHWMEIVGGSLFRCYGVSHMRCPGGRPGSCADGPACFPGWTPSYDGQVGCDERIGLATAWLQKCMRLSEQTLHATERANTSNDGESGTCLLSTKKQLAVHCHCRNFGFEHAP